jgi:hypothetical protein
MKAIVVLEAELKEYWATLLPPRHRAITSDYRHFFPPFLRYGKSLFSAYAVELAPRFADDSKFEKILRSRLQTTVLVWIAPCPQGQDLQCGEWCQFMASSWKLFKHADHQRHSHRVSEHFIRALLEARQWVQFCEHLDRELTGEVSLVLLKAYEIWQANGYPSQSAGVLDTADLSTLLPESVSKGKPKPGPKRNVADARKVFEAVGRVAGGKLSKETLSDICEALDVAKVPPPKTWRKRQPTIRTWADAGDDEPELAYKAIQHHLKNARS